MNKIVSIHYLRGIAALLVVAYHNKTSGYVGSGNHDIFEYLFKGGAFGVDLFFIISGFIIAYSTKENTKNNLINFTLKRLFRIYPILIVAITIYIFINPAYSSEEILRSYFFINRDYSKAAPFFGYNVLFPAWSLSYEVYFYFVFALAMGVSHQKRIFITSALLIIPALTLQLYFNAGISLNGNMHLQNANITPLNFFASPMMFEFVVGMFLFKIMDCFEGFKYYKSASLILLLSFLACYFTTFRFAVGLYGFGSWAILLIVAALLFEKNHGLKESRILTFFGDISYSLYLVHAITMQILMKYHDHVPFYGNNSPLKFLVILITSIVLAWILHQVIEKPMLRVGKLVLNKAKNFKKHEYQ